MRICTQLCFLNVPLSSVFLEGHSRKPSRLLFGIPALDCEALAWVGGRVKELEAHLQQREAQVRSNPTRSLGQVPAGPVRV